MTDPEPARKDATHSTPEWCRVTLASIGDAVITTDPQGRITFLNSVAESLTGWSLARAAGQPIDCVYRIINDESRRPVESPTVRALRDGVVVGLANHSLLVADDGTERPVDDSAAPIRDENGEVAGVVLVFRDISERKRQEQHLKDALTYADNIIATLREPRSSFSTARASSADGESGFLPDVSRWRKRRPKVASSMTWATASGTFLACGHCWMESCRTAIPFMTATLN